MATITWCFFDIFYYCMHFVDRIAWPEFTALHQVRKSCSASCGCLGILEPNSRHLWISNNVLSKTVCNQQESLKRCYKMVLGKKCTFKTLGMGREMWWIFCYTMAIQFYQQFMLDWVLDLVPRVLFFVATFFPFKSGLWGPICSRCFF